MKYAKKISLAPDLSLTRRASVVLGMHALGRHGTWDGYDKHAVVRRYLPKRQIEAVRQALPEKVRPFLIGLNLSEIRVLAPHIHLEEQCVINFYQQTFGEKTAFWEGEIERDDRWTTDNGNGYMNVNPEKIRAVESFIAQPGDVWILNTRQPHSVSIEGDTRSNNTQYVPENDNVRLIVQAYIDLPFDQTAECFDALTA
jgi:hypothetical protein